MSIWYYILSILLLLSTSACSTFSLSNLSDKVISEQHARAFSAPYNIVWDATRKTMEKYPIIERIDRTGQLTTGVIRNYSIWAPPPGLVDRDGGARVYEIKIFLEKGYGTTDAPAVMVRVIKEEKINKGFIDDAVFTETDGIEEAIILYRIGREIELKKKRKAYLKKRRQNPQQL